MTTSAFRYTKHFTVRGLLHCCQVSDSEKSLSHKKCCCWHSISSGQWAFPPPSLSLFFPCFMKPRRKRCRKRVTWFSILFVCLTYFLVLARSALLSLRPVQVASVNLTITCEHSALNLTKHWGNSPHSFGNRIKFLLRIVDLASIIYGHTQMLSWGAKLCGETYISVSTVLFLTYVFFHH